MSVTWFKEQTQAKSANAAETIIADLRDGISQGEISVGAKLPSENHLARHYGVSRPVVREALRSAQALGLTETRTGSGTFVISQFPKIPGEFAGFSVRDLMESRPAIEVPGAEFAAERRTDEQARNLLAICDQMDQETDPVKWIELDSLFHAAVATASGNRIFESVVSDIRGALTLQSAAVNTLADRREPSNAEHRSIAEAIAAKAPEQARNLMKAHLDYVATVIAPHSESSS